jgi:hypothetical protein
MLAPLRSARRVPPIAAVCLFLAAATAPAVDRSASSYQAALDSITTPDLARHVDYLADDALEGREAGSRGGRAAADYLAGEFSRLKLRPAGGDGRFFQPFGAGLRNVLGIVPGSDPDLADQYVVVAAHYDHVGYGNSRTSRGPVGYVHNGADDNASGTSTLLELAEALGMLPVAPRRSVLLAAFDGEEKGLLGARHWAAHPTAPIEDVTAMINLDMVGRLRNDRLIVLGWRSGCGLRRLVAAQNDGPALRLDFAWRLEDHADHWPLFDKGIPVLMFHTGLHDQYHRPSDDAELIDHAGMRRVARLVFGVICELGDRDEPVAFRSEAGREDESTRAERILASGRLPERLGVTWQPEPPSDRGALLVLVSPDSAAERAGMRPGDRIVELAGRAIRSGDDLAGAVRTAASPAKAVVRRPGDQEPLRFDVELPGSPLRLGLAWRTDDAEPGTIIVTQVVPGTAAAGAGLAAGDRIYRVGGREFADDRQFAELAGSLPAPVELVVERDGRLRTVEVEP